MEMQPRIRGDLIIIIMKFTMLEIIRVMEKKGAEVVRKGACSILLSVGWERSGEIVLVPQVRKLHENRRVIIKD